MSRNFVAKRKNNSTANQILTALRFAKRYFYFCLNLTLSKSRYSIAHVKCARLMLKCIFQWWNQRSERSLCQARWLVIQLSVVRASRLVASLSVRLQRRHKLGRFLFAFTVSHVWVAKRKNDDCLWSTRPLSWFFDHVYKCFDIIVFRFPFFDYIGL